jgi:uncharacterized protein (TIGR03437 family)
VTPLTKKYLPSGLVTHPLLARTTILAGLFLLLSSIASAQGISIVSGNGQIICSQCPTRNFMFDPLVVMVKDARGNPVPNATVSWTVKNLAGADGRVTSVTTTTASDGTSSNTIFMSSPITLLTPYLQSNITASAMGSSVTFIETDGAVTQGTGIAEIQTSLLSPLPGTPLTGDAGSTSSTPVKIAVSSYFPSGPVPGVEIRIVSDPGFPATAACTATVLTDASGTGTCNVQFGTTPGQGKIRVYVGGNYDVYGPFTIRVGAGSGNPGNPPGTPSGPTLSVNPSSLSFAYPGPVTQSVAVTSPTGSVNYTAAVQVTLAQVTWLTVGSPNAPASTGGGSNFPVTIVPQGLQSGIYRATIAVHPANGMADVIVPVQLTVGGGGTPPPTGNPFNPPPSATPGQLSAYPTSLTFQYPGGTAQTVTMSSSAAAVTYTATIQVSIAAVTWLTLGQPSGPAAAGSPSSFQVNIVPQGLQVGTYKTSILVHPGNGTSDVTIPVQLTVQSTTTQPPPPPPVSSIIYATPATMNLSSIAGAGPVNVGGITVTATGPAVQFSAVANSSGWLSITPTSSVTPSQLTVAVNASALQSGTYSGTIAITSAAASNSPLVVNVNLTVQPSQNLSLSSNVLSFTSQMDADAPPPQTVTATASSGVLTFSAVASPLSPPGVSWLQINPPAGSAGNPAANLTISVNPAGLPAGTYTGLITLTSPGAANSPQAVSVTYIISPRPAPIPTIIANAASGFPGSIAPGEILSISGTHLGPAAGVLTPLTGAAVPNLVSEVQVTFDNIPAPLLFVSDTQITTVVPFAIAGRATTRMAIVYKTTPSAIVTLNVSDTAPGIFMDPTGQATIVNNDGSTNGPAAPAVKGTVIVLYGTGEGISTPFPSDGQIAPADGSQPTTPVLPVSVSIGGIPAQVQSAGSTAGQVAGYLQVSVLVPDDAPSGSNVPVILTVGSVDSPAATMAIQ